MVVKIRLGSGPRLRHKGRKNQRLALASAALLVPAAVMAYVLAGWRLMADLSLTGQFPITGGLFSHWLVWFGAAALLHVLAIVLNRYGSASTPMEKSIEESRRDLANSRL